MRLLQGDPDRETVYSGDPVDQSRRFRDSGAELIHVVDLDGAFSGEPVNRSIVAAIARAVDIPIEIGGGIRSAETIDFYLDAGIERIILGTAILDPAFASLVSRYARCLVAGIDARDSRVAVRGWKEVSSKGAMEVIEEVLSLGVKDVIYTDISTDGMLTGPNYSALESILDASGDLRLVASGGVSSEDDIYELHDRFAGRLWGCIVGKAIYDGRVDLTRAVTGLKKR